MNYNQGMTEGKELHERRRNATKRSAEASQRKLLKWADMDNVAEEIEEGRLQTIGLKVKAEYELDEHSREDWRLMAERALDRAKLKKTPKNYPFENASNIKYPLLATAANQFAARAYPSIVDGKRIIKAQVIGNDEGLPMLDQQGQPVVDPQSGEPQWQVQPGAKRNKADRISQHMSFQLTHEMEEWEADTDMLLHQIPIVGCAFRKVWRDKIWSRNRSEMVPAMDFCVHSATRSLETVPRMTQVFELYPHECEDRVNAGLFLDCVDELQRADYGEDDDDAPLEFCEQHRLLDLDEDGFREPWIVTIHKESGKVMRIVANYDPEDIRIEDNRLAPIPRYQMFVKYGFLPDPEGGFYDIGFGELLESLSEIIDTTVNQMLDAAHLQNAGGGFIGSGLRLKKNQIRFAPGQYHVVESSGGKIRDSVYNMEHPGPSQTLFSLLGSMIEAGREVANVKDILTGDQQRAQPATTTLALIEQGMKVYTSIYKRIYRSLRKEYTLLFRLNQKHLDDESYFTILDNPAAVARSDYDESIMDVMPVADPNVVTDMQKMARAQVYMEMAGTPQFEQAGGDVREAMRRFLEATGAEDIEKLLPPPPGPSAADQLQMRDLAAEVAGKDAKTKLTQAEAEKVMSEIAKTYGQADKIRNDIEMDKENSDAKNFEGKMNADLLQILGAPPEGRPN